MKKTYQIENDSVDSRLDRWFKRKISKVPQSLIEKNLRKGNITVNGKKEKSSYKLQNKDIVTLHNLNFTSSKINKININNYRLSIGPYKSIEKLKINYEKAEALYFENLELIKK